MPDYNEVATLYDLQKKIMEYKKAVNDLLEGVNYYLSDEYTKKIQIIQNEEKALMVQLTDSKKNGVIDTAKRDAVKQQLEGNKNDYVNLVVEPMNFMKSQHETLEKAENEIYQQTQDENINVFSPVYREVMSQLNGPADALINRQELMNLLKKGAHRSTSPEKEKLILQEVKKLSEDFLSQAKPEIPLEPLSAKFTESAQRKSSSGRFMMFASSGSKAIKRTMSVKSSDSSNEEKPPRPKR